MIKIPMTRTGNNSPICYVSAGQNNIREAERAIATLEELGYKADTKILCRFLEMAAKQSVEGLK